MATRKKAYNHSSIDYTFSICLSEKGESGNYLKAPIVIVMIY